MVFTMPVDLIRLWFGPLPMIICDLNLIARSVTANSMGFVFTLITIFKYLFICVWKKIPSHMDDNFLAFFCTSSALLFGLFTGWAKYYLPGRLVFNQVKVNLILLMAFFNFVLSKAKQCLDGKRHEKCYLTKGVLLISLICMLWL